MNLEDIRELTNSTPAFILFSADWCGPCKMIKPILDSISVSRKDFEYKVVDITDNLELAKEMQVRNIPNLSLVSNGSIKESITGCRPRKEIEAFIDAWK